MSKVECMAPDGEGPFLWIGMQSPKPDSYMVAQKNGTVTMASMVRDRHRLDAVKEDTGHQVFTMDKWMAECDDEKSEMDEFHLQCSVNTDRCLRSRGDEFKERFVHPLSLIHSAWMRMPTAYLAGMMSKGFMRQFLVSLFQNGIAAPHAPVILPNYLPSMAFLDRSRWDITLIHDPMDLVFYRVTECMSNEELGGYDAKHELQQLDPRYPFVCLHYHW
jgi:hypothetical protein